jgi:hypothetical protein
VYRSSSPILNDITLISLNDLADEPHNALCRLFTSKKKEKARALLRVIRSGIGALPETVTEFIVKFADAVFRPMEERLKGIPVKERLSGLSPEELDELEKSLRELRNDKKKKRS